MNAMIAGRVGVHTGCGNLADTLFCVNDCDGRGSQHGAWEKNDILVPLRLIASFMQGCIFNK